MNKKGGRTSTTWDGGWRLGETTTIRIPKLLKDELMAYARARDAGDCLLQGNKIDIVLSAIAKYIIYKRQHYHPNQHSTELDITTRSWDELRKFRAMAQREPKILGLKNE